MLFDKLCLLSQGKQHYFGPVTEVVPYYESIGLDVPVHSNPAEWLLELINVDFAEDRANAQTLLGRLQEAWTSSSRCQQLRAGLRQVESFGSTGAETLVGSGGHSETKPGQLSLVLTLLHRSFVKSHRDVVAYGIRMAMYTGLAIMMGTVWLRLEPEQSSIQPFINAICGSIHFVMFFVHVSRGLGWPLSITTDLLTALFRQSLARLSCPSWRLPMFPRSSKIGCSTSRSTTTDYMAQRP